MSGPFDGTWGGESGARRGRIWDISLGGCYVEALNDQRTGERIQVQISLPEGLVSADRKVVYSIRNQGFALRLVAVADDSRDVLTRALARLLQDA